MDGDDQGIGAVSRWNYAPAQEGSDIWHLGASLGWEEVKHGWRAKSRPENHLANTLYQASPTVSGQQSIVRANAEWAMQRGSLHTQAEVFHTKAQDGMQSTGGFWQAGWFVSEDIRAYSYKSGYWKSTTPSQNYGAIELTARLSYLDVQNALPTDLSGLGLTVGLNWTFHEHARMLVNHSRHHRHASPAKQSVEATMVRFQWTF